MTDTEIIEIINNNQQCVEFGVRFKAKDAVQEILERDDNPAETLKIFASFLRDLEGCNEGRITRSVYSWANKYDGPTVDDSEYGALYHEHPYLLNGFFEEFIKQTPDRA